MASFGTKAVNKAYLPYHIVNNVKLTETYKRATMCAQYTDLRNQAYGIDLGTKALSKEFPHMAAVGFVNNETNNIFWLCGGTLISHYFILSAAHCAHSYDYGPARWIRLGDLDLNDTTEEADPHDVKIRQIYVHPEYKPSSHYHDVALFKLESWIEFGNYFNPACLQTEKALPDTLEAIGWGKLGFFGEGSSHLMKVKLKIVDYGTCAKRFVGVSSRKLKSGIVDHHQMCAGDELGGDTCPGDSGGPLHYTKMGSGFMLKHFVVAGITSFGKGCGGTNTAAVYTRVSFYVGWIENIVWPEQYLATFSSTSS